MVQYFIEEAGASISDHEATDEGETVWDLVEPLDADPVALASLPKVMAMLGDAPPAFVAKLSPEHAELTTRGRHFRSEPRCSSTAPCLLCCCQSLRGTP
jgi:hypothetical protein